MSRIEALLCIMLVDFITAFSQLNLDLTDWVSASERNGALEHDCLRVASLTSRDIDPRQIISYCMSEWPSRWSIQPNTRDPKFTFAELYLENITSQQLYLWSAPMDTVELYQSYLNQIPNSFDESGIIDKVFYNCTLPRFGPACQYELDQSQPFMSSLSESTRDYYRQHGYEPIALTCYTHLQCFRGPSLACLDWSEICDDKIDCLDGGRDEANCWELNTSECKSNEHQCSNGQCIPLDFLNDNVNFPDCLDGTDENFDLSINYKYCNQLEPTFGCEDVACTGSRTEHASYFTSSCMKKRTDILWQAMFAYKPGPVDAECWWAFSCFLQVSVTWMNRTCNATHGNGTLEEIILRTCPKLLYMPSVPVLYGDLYFAYNSSDIDSKLPSRNREPKYVCYTDKKWDECFFDGNILLFNNATCRSPDDTKITSESSVGRETDLLSFTDKLYKQLWVCNTAVNTNDSAYCNSSRMYQCINSTKCIPRSRLFDSIPDCLHGDDEQWTSNSASPKKHQKSFKCTGTNQFIGDRAVGDGICQCPQERFYDDWVNHPEPIAESHRV